MAGSATPTHLKWTYRSKHRAQILSTSSLEHSAKHPIPIAALIRAMWGSRNRKRYCFLHTIKYKKLQSENGLPFRLPQRHRRLAWSSETLARREVVAAWTDCTARRPGAWWPEVVHCDGNLRDSVPWSRERWLAAKRTLPGPPMQPMSLCSYRNAWSEAWSDACTSWPGVLNIAHLVLIECSHAHFKRCMLTRQFSSQCVECLGWRWALPPHVRVYSGISGMGTSLCLCTVMRRLLHP